MAIPDFQTLMLPLLESLVDGKEHAMRDVTAALADRFHLTDAERQEKLPSGQQTVISNRVAWAKAHLKGAGLVENPTRGLVRLAELGRTVVGQKPAVVNCRFLKQYPTYLKFIGQVGSDAGEEVDEAGVAGQKTPLELLDESYTTLRKATVEELLSRLKTTSPGFFEEVVVRLLRAMGYGGVTGEGTVTGKSGDGGIDGVIKEDKLGLDVVCLQAKRWENSVGRPTIQQFVGSMDYIRARKGVIITTSQFTRDATEFVDRIEGKKVVLIDGVMLAELMLDHNVGVTRTKVYELKEVSNDFFDEDDGIA
ncbi:MAG: restriction endonuclease [Gemmata sp.]